MSKRRRQEPQQGSSAPASSAKPSSAPASSAKPSLRKWGLLGLAAVAAVVVVVATSRRSSGIPASEIKRYNTEVANYEAHRRALVSEYEERKAEVAQLQAQLRETESAAGANSREFRSWFGLAKQDCGETEQQAGHFAGLDFMLKEDQDKKKNDLMRRAEALQQKGGELQRALQAAADRMSEISAIYRANFE